MDKFTHLFADVSSVTISGIIARERTNARNSDLPTLEENIMKKILWYRDLPLEEGNLPQEMSYDQASFKYKKPVTDSASTTIPVFAVYSASSPPAKEQKQGTITLPQVDKLGWKADQLFQGADDQSGTSALPPPILPPLPQTKGRVSLSGVFKVPPPPPSIATPAPLPATGHILQSELRAFVLLACLDYLRSKQVSSSSPPLSPTQPHSH